jgi:hypothetical protein
VLPPPAIFLATGDNCEPSADAPAAPAADVVRVSGAVNRFSVDVPKVDDVAAVQQSPTLCWAACTQMLLRQQKVEIDQHVLGNYFEPDPDDQTAGVGVILRALNPDLQPKLEQRGAVPVDLVGITSDQMLQELMAGHLCVVGLVDEQNDGYGHACVVCGATFARLHPSPLAMLAGAPAAPDGHPGSAAVATPADAIRSKLSPDFGLYQVELFDPEPGIGRRTVDAATFQKQAVFLTSHILSRQMLLTALGESPTASKGGASERASSGSTSSDRTTSPQPNQVIVRSQSWDDARLMTLPVRRQSAAIRVARTANPKFANARPTAAPRAQVTQRPNVQPRSQQPLQSAPKQRQQTPQAQQQKPVVQPRGTPSAPKAKAKSDENPPQTSP